MITEDLGSALARPQTLAEDWPQLPDSREWTEGLRIGPYRLQRQLGRGGMGMVWLAEQLHPLQREVALKVMASGEGDAYREAWFEIERQALAQLSHPGIAQIFDAGRLPDGSLFFAMEHVPGVPLDAFQRQHRLPEKAVAGLFVQICAAVQHAHQRGLIHRDLKPQNVLVRLLDGAPVAKIIDFGIAVRALPGAGAIVDADRIAGTPAYMAPEQRRPGPHGIDARADLYALGVMLIEALCRARDPGARLDTIDVTAVRRMAGAEIDFPREAAADTRSAALRRCPGELLAIAGKAIARDREQRYASAAALAEDLGRWLARRPVAAMHGGRLYVLSCLVRRNRILSSAVVAILLAILVGFAMAWHGMTEAQRAQALAERRRDDAERLIQFMLGDFADRLRPLGRLELLDSVGQEALAYLSAQTDESLTPEASLSRARALRTLGEVRTTRQQFADADAALAAAEAILAPAMKARPRDAELLFEAGQIAFYRGAVAFRQDHHAAAAPHWQRYLEHARAQRALDPDGVTGLREVAYAYSNLGTLAERRGELEEARGHFLQVMEVRERLVSGPGDPNVLDLANTLSWLGRLHFALGDEGSAWRYAAEALRKVQAHHRAGGDSARQRQLEINLLYVLARYAVAIGLDEQANAGFRRALVLAGEDVALDPTQPRRQSMLARIAFQLAARPGMPETEASAALEGGEAALQAIGEAALAAGERLELDSWRHLARRRLPRPADGYAVGNEEAGALVHAALAAIRAAPGSESALLQAAAEVALGMDPVDRALLGEVRQLLDASSRSEPDLGALLLRRDLALAEGQSEVAEALSREIDGRRARVLALQNSGPGGQHRAIEAGDPDEHLP